MALFREETEEEKIYNRIIKTINNTHIEYAIKEDLKNIVMDAKEGRKNHFFELDFLERIIGSFLTVEYNGYEEFKELFTILMKEINYYLSLGIHTKDYEKKKEFIINNVTNPSLFNQANTKLYDLLSFDNYVRAIKIISREDISGYEDLIADYIVKIAPYIENETLLLNELISFIEEFKNNDNYEEIIDRRIEEARKRIGIYGIDEKTVAIIAEEVKKAEKLKVSLELMDTKVKNYKKRIDKATTEGEKRIKDVIENGSTELEEMIQVKANLIIEELDEYLKKIEETMKQNSNKVFQEILENSSKRIREIRQVAIEIQSSTSSELLRIKQASEEATDKLKSYVENEPSLQELIKASSESSEVRSALIRLSSAKPDSIIVSQSDEISDAARIITPGPVIVVEDTEYEKEILDIFNESIPYEDRFAMYLKKKKEREEKGEFFHVLADESAGCIIENEWLYGYGPSGSGKTKTIEQIAGIMGTEIIPNGKITDKYSLMAYNDPHGRFRPTPAYLASTKGKILLLDEFDNGNPDTQVALNELYSASIDVQENPRRPRYVYFGENIAARVHPNFRMISLGNTNGLGEDEQYSSRAKIDESVIERMTPKFFDYDERLEDKIMGENIAFRNFLRNIRITCDNYARKIQGSESAQGNITTRDLSFIAKFIKHNSKTMRQIIYEKIIQTKDAEYVRYLGNAIAKLYSIEKIVEPVIGSTPLKQLDEETMAKSLVYECKKYSERTM